MLYNSTSIYINLLYFVTIPIIEVNVQKLILIKYLKNIYKHHFVEHKEQCKDVFSLYTVSIRG